MKKLLTLTSLILFIALLTALAQNALVVERQSATAHTILAPEAAGQLMSMAYMRSGQLRITNDMMVISGQAYIELPLEQASQLVILPDGYAITNVTLGRFTRTTNGFEITVTLIK